MRDSKEELTMDIFMLKLSTKYMKGLVAKIISRKMSKKFGYKVDIQLNDVQIDVIDGEVKIHIDADGKMNKTEFNKLIKEISKD